MSVGSARRPVVALRRHLVKPPENTCRAARRLEHYLAFRVRQNHTYSIKASPPGQPISLRWPSIHLRVALVSQFVVVLGELGGIVGVVVVEILGLNIERRWMLLNLIQLLDDVAPH